LGAGAKGINGRQLGNPYGSAERSSSMRTIIFLWKGNDKHVICATYGEEVRFGQTIDLTILSS
jgi:hypothetical protein